MIFEKYRNMGSNLLTYEYMAREYRKEFSSEDLDKLEKAYKAKLKLLNTNYDVEFLRINGKTFIRSIVGAGKIHIILPKFIFGFAKFTDMTIFTGPITDITITFSRPCVIINRARDDIKDDGYEYYSKYGGMFEFCAFLQSVKLENFYPMFCELNKFFYYCKNLKYVDFGKYCDTSAIKQMNEVFGMCSNIRSIVFPEGFTTKHVDSYYRTFYDCGELHTVKASSEFDLFTKKHILIKETVKFCRFDFIQNGQKIRING